MRLFRPGCVQTGRSVLLKIDKRIHNESNAPSSNRSLFHLFCIGICVHNLKLLSLTCDHCNSVIDSNISFDTVTLRFDESLLSKHSKTRNVAWTAGKDMNRTFIFQKGQLRRQRTKDVNRNRNNANTEQTNLTRRKTRF